MQFFTSDDVHPSPADPKTFTGPARVARLTTGDAHASARVYRVEFGRDARLHWHEHSGVQWLFVVDGSCRVQQWGEPARDLVAGDSVCIEAGAKHWHGAAPGRTGTHIAVNLGATTTWGEEVTEEEYKGEVSRRDL
ncbi:MAG TPA: cupin domain-containing protein [Vicinamibacterales bacterium]|nr:cupin domain-containing protein [Vicinamibacterales bacterium]